MKKRSLAAIGLAALLTLTACGGSAGDAPAAQENPAPMRPELSETTSARISTFALDVDTASYSYARRTLREGR
ncbi:von Willebrand factor type A domain-containing protein [Nonomuraea ferruginea]